MYVGANDGALHAFATEQVGDLVNDKMYGLLFQHL